LFESFSKQQPFETPENNVEDEVLLESPAPASEQEEGSFIITSSEQGGNTGSTKKSGPDEDSSCLKSEHQKIQKVTVGEDTNTEHCCDEAWMSQNEQYKAMSIGIFEDSLAIYEKIFSNIVKNRKHEISRELFHPKNQESYVNEFKSIPAQDVESKLNKVPSDVISKLKNIVFDDKMDNVRIKS
jgi:hypothetical protein